MQSGCVMPGIASSLGYDDSGGLANHNGMFEQSVGSGTTDLPMQDGLPEYSEIDPAWTSFDVPSRNSHCPDIFEPPKYQVVASSGSSRTALGSASGMHTEFQMATSSGSGSGSEARSGSESCGSATSNTESDESVDSGDELWKQAKVSDSESKAVFGISSDAISQAYAAARSQAYRPPRSRIPKIPDSVAPPGKTIQKELRKLKRAAKAEAVNVRNKFLQSFARQQAIGSFSMPSHRPAILLGVEPPHCIVDVNEEWCRLCCFSRDEVLGQPYTITHGPGTEKNRVARFNAAFAAGVGCIGVLT